MEVEPGLSVKVSQEDITNIYKMISNISILLKLISKSYSKSSLYLPAERTMSIVLSPVNVICGILKSNELDPDLFASFSGPTP